MSEPTSFFALSTAPGRAALAVIRLTGPTVDKALVALGVSALPPPRMVGLRRLLDPSSGVVLDEALVLRFVAPHSFTGDDMAELHVHGGAAVTASILQALGRLDFCAPAEPGAFTRQAVMNGKMDLTAAEAIADLIDAEGSAQQAQAMQQMGGALRDLLDGWREQLKTMTAHVEADLEFADEDLPGGLGQSALAGVADLRTALQAHLDDRRGVTLRDGVRVALLGVPNVGKSSILNMLAGREAAIVSARAGTTRDVIEVAMLLDGVPVTLVDTAGLRTAGDDIEREGVRRALSEAAHADIRILVVSADTQAGSDADSDTDSDFDTETALGQLETPDFIIGNKVDLAPPDGSVDVLLSTVSRQGEEALLAALQRIVANRAGLREAPALTRERHHAALSEALAHLDRAIGINHLAGGTNPAGGVASDRLELAAEDLRLAQRALGRITGAVDVEMLLDVVFADFCIGK